MNVNSEIVYDYFNKTNDINGTLEFFSSILHINQKFLKYQDNFNLIKEFKKNLIHLLEGNQKITFLHHEFLNCWNLGQIKSAENKILNAIKLVSKSQANDVLEYDYYISLLQFYDWTMQLEKKRKLIPKIKILAESLNKIKGTNDETFHTPKLIIENRIIQKLNKRLNFSFNINVNVKLGDLYNELDLSCYQNYTDAFIDYQIGVQSLRVNNFLKADEFFQVASSKINSYANDTEIVD